MVLARNFSMFPYKNGGWIKLKADYSDHPLVDFPINPWNIGITQRECGALTTKRNLTRFWGKHGVVIHAGTSIGYNDSYIHA